MQIQIHLHVHMYIYIYTYTHAFAHTYTFTYTNTNIRRPQPITGGARQRIGFKTETFSSITVWQQFLYTNPDTYTKTYPIQIQI